jgi:alkylation response protein AidB-like acyl-CoA dehydrogenase
MDFRFSDEQQMLCDGLRSFLRARYPFDRRIAGIRSEEGWSREVWSALSVELGLLGIGSDERFGGSGGGAIENMIVMHEFGRALVVEPYLETVVIGATALARGGAYAEQLLGSLIAGDAVLAFAWAEPSMRYDIAQTAMTATRQGAGWRIDGVKIAVSAAPWADYLITVARTAGLPGARDGLSLFVIPKAARGITEHAYPTVDGRRASDFTFSGVTASAEALLGRDGDAAETVDLLMDCGIAAIAAEAVGAMEHMHAATLAYSKERRQFGQPLGNFQVLQHRLVDMHIKTELARAAAYRATLLMNADSASRGRAVSGAKVTIADACRFVGQNAIQLHGGMGMTDELSISHYFRRTTMIEFEFGAADYHLARYARLAREPAHPLGLAA